MNSKMKTNTMTVQKLLAFIMIFSMLAMAEKAPTPSLPLPTSGNVTLALAEYNKLVDLASKARKHETPPVAYTLKHADLKFKVGEGVVLGTVQLDGEVFGRSSAKVPLITGMTILNARQEGKTLPLLQEGSTATAVLPGPGEFSANLDAGMPLLIEAGRAAFNLPVPAAGSVRLSLVIPGEHTNVHISPGLITNRASANGQTTVEATMVPGQPASIWWATREIAAPVVPREVRFLSDVKTLVTVSESDLRIAALADVTVVQGDPTEFKIVVPTDYEITDVSGATIEGSEVAGNELTVRLNASKPRSHQFLITMEKPLLGTVKAETPFLNFKDTQRETGEVLVEGTGAMELTSTEGGILKRMDVKEVSPYLRSLARFPTHAAFRFHRQPQPAEAPKLALEWVRFPDSNVLAAVAERAVVTTLVTTEGRSLTEVKLTVKNQAQPFLKLDLPADATILSAEVAGEKVKPVQGADGSRIPLLRAGFRPTDAYEVTFVFLHSGAPFAKKGGSDLALPSMDVPISLLQWEVFLPEQYKVKDFGGDAIAMSLLQPRYRKWLGENVGYLVSENEESDRLALFTPGVTGESNTADGIAKAPVGGPIPAGQLGGVVMDPQGAVVPGVRVTVTDLDRGLTRTTTTDANGNWLVMGMPTGRVQIKAEAPGFSKATTALAYDASRGSQFNFRLNVGQATTTVEVTSEAPLIETTQSQVSRSFSGSPVSSYTGGRHSDKEDRDAKKQMAQLQNQASANVFNLQKKVSGVLPVRVDVPRAGNSYKFARALVLDEETKLTFNYKTK